MRSTKTHHIWETFCSREVRLMGARPSWIPNEKPLQEDTKYFGAYCSVCGRGKCIDVEPEKIGLLLSLYLVICIFLEAVVVAYRWLFLKEVCWYPSKEKGVMLEKFNTELVCNCSLVLIIELMYSSMERYDLYCFIRWELSMTQTRVSKFYQRKNLPTWATLRDPLVLMKL